MSDPAILISSEAGLWRITLNRPDRLNSFTAAMHAELADALDKVEADTAGRLLVITGAGRAFCAGQDLGERDVDAGPPDLGYALEHYYNPLVRRLTALPIPVLCAVNGVAAGAGVNLVAACDIVIARHSARFVQAFSSIGLIPDAGGSWNLPRAMGLPRALGFTLLGEPITASEAESFGLIWKAVDDDAFDVAVEAIITKLARGPTFGLGLAKRLLRDGLDSSLAGALDAERDAQRCCGTAPDYREGVTAFTNKRVPQFTGGQPDPNSRPPRIVQ